MPSTHGITGSKWFTCDQCGFDYPVKFRARQRGLSFCTYIPCFDEPGRLEDNDPRNIVSTEPPDED